VKNAKAILFFRKPLRAGVLFGRLGVGEWLSKLVAAHQSHRAFSSIFVMMAAISSGDGSMERRFSGRLL